MINRRVLVQLPRIAAQSQQPFRWELSKHSDVQNIVAVAAPAGFEIGKWLGIPEEKIEKKDTFSQLGTRFAWHLMEFPGALAKHAFGMLAWPSMLSEVV